MPPTQQKKKKAKKAPAYLTADDVLAPFGVKVGSVVHSSLGCSGTVLGVKVSAAGSELWVRWANGIDAPADAAGGARLASAAEQLRREIEARARAQVALDAKWQAFNEEQERRTAEAAKAAAKKKKKPAAPAAGPAPPAEGGVAAPDASVPLTAS